jgi:carbon monoxide dehydrogenase subunit G
MEFSGRYAIPAPPETVWAGLNDPDLLKTCIPGCEQIEKTSPTDFVATARLKIGPVSAAFKGKVALSELDPPHRCILSGEGQGGVAGFAKGDAEVVLKPDASGTVLTYKAKANVGGKLAQIGQRLIDGAAKQIADDFFERFAKAVAPAPASAATDTAEAAAATTGGVAPPPASVRAQLQAVEDRRSRDGLAPEIWVVGLIAIVAILLVVFGMVL